jgi:hypothetical protein
MTQVSKEMRDFLETRRVAANTDVSDIRNAIEAARIRGICVPPGIIRGTPNYVGDTVRTFTPTLAKCCRCGTTFESNGFSEPTCTPCVYTNLVVDGDSFAKENERIACDFGMIRNIHYALRRLMNSPDTATSTNILERWIYIGGTDTTDTTRYCF